MNLVYFEMQELGGDLGEGIMRLSVKKTKKKKK